MFDEVNHDYLMTLIKRKVRDPLVLRLIWKYLRSPMQIDGKLQKRRKGVPQGGPLSPLLSNIVLNELDQELEERALRFVRYADDFSVFVKTPRAAQRVKRRITRFIENRLHLLVNEKKNAICRPCRPILGTTITLDRLKSRGYISFLEYYLEISRKTGTHC